MSATLDGRLAAVARALPERPALVWDRPAALADDAPDAARGQLDFAALDAAVDAACVWLSAHGARVGERVAWCLAKGPAAVVVHLACLRLGAVSVPLNPRATAAERSHVLDAASPVLLVTDTAHGGTDAGAVPTTLTIDPHALPGSGAPGAERHDATTEDADLAPAHEPHDGAPAAAHSGRWPIPAPDDLACLLFTSGTTGQPKGVMLTHAGLAANDAALRVAWSFSAEDTLLHVLPLFHVHGLYVALHLALGSGACVRLVDSFDAERVWRLLRDEAISVLMAVPTMHHRLLASAPGPRVALPHLRLVTSGSAPLRAATLDAFEALTGQRILERYGMTEVGMATSNPYDGERRAGSVGLDLPGMHTRLVDADGAPVADGDVGQVQIRGDALCAGYWRQPEATAEAFGDDGWLRSGDLGRRDEAGYLVLVGRSKELIISGGFNIVPGEVEELLLTRDELAEVAVFGLPDDDLGERVVAALVAAPGRSVDTAALHALCQQRLSGYKRPRELFVVEALPRNALGKLQRGRLPDWVSANRAR